MAQSINLKCLSNVAQDEEHLHVALCAVWSDRSAKIVQKPKISGPDVLHIWIAVDEPPVKAFRIESVL